MFQGGQESSIILEANSLHALCIVGCRRASGASVAGSAWLKTRCIPMKGGGIGKHYPLGEHLEEVGGRSCSFGWSFCWGGVVQFSVVRSRAGSMFSWYLDECSYSFLLFHEVETVTKGAGGDYLFLWWEWGVSLWRGRFLWSGYHVMNIGMWQTVISCQIPWLISWKRWDVWIFFVFRCCRSYRNFSRICGGDGSAIWTLLHQGCIYRSKGVVSSAVRYCLDIATVVRVRGSNAAVRNL